MVTRRVAAKICGVSTTAALDAALAGGASHIGLVFFARSPRNVAPEHAAALVGRAASRAKIVGLFVDPDPAELAAGRERAPLDVLQLHGDEPPAALARMSGD